MAKRRFFRKAARRSFSVVRRASRRYNASENVMTTVLPAAVYGASRAYISNAISPLTSKVPLGNYADEIVLGPIGYFMNKKGSGLVKSAGKAILIVEAASLGNQVANGMMTSTGGNNSNYYA
jgi:hypothetical protein